MDDVYEAEDGDAIPSDAYAPEDEDLPEDEFGGWSEASAEAVSLSKIAECTRITFDPLEEVFWAGDALVRETHIWSQRFEPSCAPLFVLPPQVFLAMIVRPVF